MNLPAPAFVPAPAASTPSAVVKDLTGILAATIALAVKTHGAHWNVRGPGFFRLHAAFETQYQELYLAADELAERLRALGEAAPASLGQLTDLSSISETPRSDDDALVRVLRDDHRHLADRLRTAIVVAKAAGDEQTAELLIGRIRSHDKTAWMLTATLGE